MSAVTADAIHTRTTDYFYLYMGIVCLAVAFIGFAPTYWTGLLRGTFQANPVIHIHGATFFAWTVFVVFQTWLAASGRLRRHRRWGFVGVSLATAMVMLGILAAINSMKVAAGLGLTDAGKAFAIVPLASISFFGTLVTLAIVKARQIETHKRLMLLASISILDAPIARWFITFLAPPGPPGPPPVAVDLLPAAVTLILLCVALVFDWRTRGRPHSAYVIGGVALVALKLGQIPLSTTSLWQSFTGWMLALAHP